jgi:hypothetical protein
MYLHLGNGVVVRREDILAVCDLDNTSQSIITRKYLSRAEKAGQVVNVAELELPKSFVVCADGKGAQVVYLCQLNSSTLLKRSEEQGLE